MDDPEDKKPEGWDDIPAQITDPEAKKPEDWDDDEDGEWTAPMVRTYTRACTGLVYCFCFCFGWGGAAAYRHLTSSTIQIDNPEYMGEWKPKRIKNPAYKGPWVHPEVRRGLRCVCMCVLLFVTSDSSPLIEKTD